MQIGLYICRRTIITLLQRGFQIALLVVVLCVVAAPPVHSAIQNQLYRVDIRPVKDFTRITVRLQNSPEYSVAELPGNRLRIIIQNTEGSLFKKFRRYSDTNIGGVIFSRRGETLLATFQIASGAGWRDLTRDGISAITLDIGKGLRPPSPKLYIAGRERIWVGVEKLVRDFEPPLKTEIPFLPTDRQILTNILDSGDQQTFMSAEAALYKGHLSEAEEIFSRFSTRQTPVRSLALYRLGETSYKLQKYPQALAAFREAEKLWGTYLNYNPGVTFYYGDSIARCGDLSAARTMLSGLIGRLADKKYAPALLVRLGDVLARQGHELESVGLYRTVTDNFRDSTASRMALLRQNDRIFLQATPWNYRPLSESYQKITQLSDDLDLREEAHFKSVLLESLHGETGEALRMVMEFQKRFPRSNYSAVCKTMREVMVSEAYRSTAWVKDAAGLVRFVEEHQEFLSGCMGQPSFLSNVSRAYGEVGRPIDLITFFNSLSNYQWAVSGLPFMYETIVDNADLLGDAVMTEKYMRLFLRKYPTHPHARMILERLGGVYSSTERYQETKDVLLWLLNKGEKAQKTESYFILGKSLWMLKQYAMAAKAMDAFLSSGSGRNEQQIPEAYYIAISSLELSGDRKGAIRLLDVAIKLPDNKRKDELLYKAGDLNLLEGKRQVARGYFDQIAKKSIDPEWKKLAQQAIAGLDAKVSPEATLK